jgi:Uma2 family endonuclease
MVMIMQVSRERRRVTLDEFERMQKEDAYRLSLVRGHVVREPRPGGRHGYVMGRVYWVLEEYVRATGAGAVYIDVGVVTRADPPTVRGPDVVVYLRGRVADPWPDGFFRVAPDLAVEIVSPWNRKRDLLEKIDDYLSAGARMVWLVDPRRRTVDVHRPGQPVVQLTQSDTVSGFGVLPGLSVSVSELLTPVSY